MHSLLLRKHKSFSSTHQNQSDQLKQMIWFSAAEHYSRTPLQILCIYLNITTNIDHHHSDNSTMYSKQHVTKQRYMHFQHTHCLFGSPQVWPIIIDVSRKTPKLIGLASGQKCNKGNNELNLFESGKLFHLFHQSEFTRSSRKQRARPPSPTSSSEVVPAVGGVWASHEYSRGAVV